MLELSVWHVLVRVSGMRAHTTRDVTPSECVHSNHMNAFMHTSMLLVHSLHSKTNPAVVSQSRDVPGNPR